MTEKTYDGWDEGWRHPAHEQILPVDVPEEGLLLHVLGVALRSAQAAFRIFT